MHRYHKIEQLLDQLSAHEATQAALSLCGQQYKVQIQMDQIIVECLHQVSCPLNLDDATTGYILQKDHTQERAPKRVEMPCWPIGTHDWASTAKRVTNSPLRPGAALLMLVLHGAVEKHSKGLETHSALETVDQIRRTLRAREMREELQGAYFNLILRTTHEWQARHAHSLGQVLAISDNTEKGSMQGWLRWGPGNAVIDQLIGTPEPQRVDTSMRIILSFAESRQISHAQLLKEVRSSNTHLLERFARELELRSR